MKAKLNKAQILTIVIGFGLVVLILLLPRVPSDNGNKIVKEADHTHFSIDDYIVESKGKLTPDSKAKIDFFEHELSHELSEMQKVQYLDSLAWYWQVLNKPVIGAEYKKQIAVQKNDIESWFVAGDVYYNSFRNEDESLKTYLIQEAVKSYEKILELDANDLGAVNALGVAYVEGAAYLNEQPMKGIGLIRSVLEKDPENIDALINLGYFAIQSGQYDKAIERFNHVLRIDSAQIESYLYLTDIYVSLKEMDKAIVALNKYKSFINDEDKKRQIEAYILDLKTN